MAASGRRKHTGWFLYKLRRGAADLPHTAAGTAAVAHYCVMPGIKRKFCANMAQLCLRGPGAWRRETLQKTQLFLLSDNFFFNPLLSSAWDATFIKKLYSIRLLAARSIRAILAAKQRPVHGQRRWSNANTARRCNLFLRSTLLAYETELLGLGHKKAAQWSKMYELRQKAKLQKKKPAKKWTKFKKFGEKRLVVKKKKKGPWD